MTPEGKIYLTFTPYSFSRGVEPTAGIGMIRGQMDIAQDTVLPAVHRLAGWAASLKAVIAWTRPLNAAARFLMLATRRRNEMACPSSQ